MLVAGAVAMALAVVGCGGGGRDEAGSAEEPGVEGASATPADEVALSRRTVRNDIRSAAAAGGFRQVQINDNPRGAWRPGCVLVAAVRTPDEPERKAVAKVVAALKARDWKQKGHLTEGTGVEGSGEFWSLERGNWAMDFSAGSASPEEAAATLPKAERDQAEGLSGLVFFVNRRDCRAAAPPAPTASD